MKTEIKPQEIIKTLRINELTNEEKSKLVNKENLEKLNKDEN